jgi:heterodisulfide reductase subunit B2
MKKFTYYPGCSSHGTSQEYEHTMKLVMQALDVKLDYVPDWNCCGATSAHVMTESLAIALPMRNLILAEKLENDTLAIPCASCYSRMKETKLKLDADPDIRKEINTIVEDGEYKGTVEVKSLLQYCYENIGLEDIKHAVKTPLYGLKVACYYGCLLTRPTHVAEFDSPEYPMSMDHLVEALGAKAIDFDYKTECCGASFSISNTEVVYSLTGKILEVAKEAGADIIVVGCPLCQSNLDMRQQEIEKITGKNFHLPVVYFTQLMALAFGYPASDLKFNKHIVAVEPALAKITKDPPREGPVKGKKQKPETSVSPIIEEKSC